MKGYYREAWYAFARAAVLKPRTPCTCTTSRPTLQEIGSARDARTHPRVGDEELSRTSIRPSAASGTTCCSSVTPACAAAALARRPARSRPRTGSTTTPPAGCSNPRAGRPTRRSAYYEAAFGKGYGGSGNEGGARPAQASRRTSRCFGGGEARSAGEHAKRIVSRRRTPRRPHPGRLGRPLPGEGRQRAFRPRRRRGHDLRQGHVASTTLTLKTLACAQSASTMEVSSKSGAITGRGRLMYVYQGGAGGAATMLAPAAAATGAGGFAVNLKDGKQFRDWSFRGQVSPDGTVEIEGIPDEPMDLLNVGKWEKHRPWSGAAARPTRRTCAGRSA
jgi:hypothetical protein